MTEGEKPKSSEPKVEEWKHDSHFMEYLLLLARKKKDALESIDQFPKSIELNGVWHETFNKMREETKDGHERWALIGFRNDMRKLILPSVYGFGERRNILKGIRAHVPSEVIDKEIKLAKEKAGIIGLVGDVHSHPPSPDELVVKELFGSARIIGGGGGFSAGDLYGMVVPDLFHPVRALVEVDDNLYVFKTRESKDIPVSQELFSMDAFEKYWHKKLGIKSIGKLKVSIPWSYSTIKMNKAIAEKHKLVIYKGVPSKILYRVYPD